MIQTFIDTNECANTNTNTMNINYPIRLQKIINSFPFAKPVLLLGLLGAFGTFLLIVRIIYSREFTFAFLVWNLFLAIIPYFFASMLWIKYRGQKLSWSAYVLFALWLLFFPNAPYIITDFIHLRPRGIVPLWYDLLLISSFAWDGMLVGLISLRIIHIFIKEKGHTLIARIVVFVTLGMGSFGVYLGRYLRWNSWDVLIHPQDLFHDIIGRVVNPFQHPRTYTMTIILWVFLFLLYVILKNINNEKWQPTD